MKPVLTSTRHPLVRRIRALAEREAREAEGRLLVEGIRLLEEVLDAGIPIEVLVYDPDAATGRAAAVLARARQQGARLVPAAPHVVAACSQVETPQGLVAVVHRPTVDEQALLASPDLLLTVADGVQDPGNLGAIIRAADAAGATGVLVTGGVDPHHPKVVRASMGSLFHLPVKAVPPAQARDLLAGRGVRVLVADPRGEVEYTEADYSRPVALVVGSEARGPDPAWRDAAETTVRIPLYGRAESLNVALAAGLLLYEARRWERGKKEEGRGKRGERA
ncbi:MAG: RNA methyltransferase [Armatimonadota bacterium]|nr:RNA methyltransferase [Armatimonadota bacterium]MDR7402800.1 RNA methyltransferase [Armatimonadota bacterium]MDR7404647.1 RNA methyltransferase [Armatimonadota bacterium]